jgi:F-type H+-transporting ATPase subunit epsilon
MSNNNLINFEIVTPEKTVLAEKAKRVTLPTREGEISILPHHIPLVSIIKAGVIEIENGKGEIEVMSISGGFIEVLKDKVVVLADTAERALEIDESRANEARNRAEELKKELTTVDMHRFTELNTVIAKELARSRAVRRWKKIKKLDN